MLINDILRVTPEGCTSSALHDDGLSKGISGTHSQPSPTRQPHALVPERTFSNSLKFSANL